VLIGLTKVERQSRSSRRRLATLSDVVTAECALAGLDAGDLDVSELTDDVRGYIGAPRPLGANLAPADGDLRLRRGRVRRQAQVRQARRGLGRHHPGHRPRRARAGGDKPPAPIEHSHAQEQALPAEVRCLPQFLDDDRSTSRARSTRGARRAMRAARSRSSCRSSSPTTRR
jgi:hypothetical protein